MHNIIIMAIIYHKSVPSLFCSLNVVFLEALYIEVLLYVHLVGQQCYIFRSTCTACGL